VTIYVGLDADGVLFNFDHSLAALAASEWGITMPEEPSTWSLHKQILGQKKWTALWNRNILLRKMFRLEGEFDPTYYMNQEMVSQLNALPGVQLGVITARPTRVAMATAEAFGAAFGQEAFARFSFLKDKTKAKPLPHIFLDDKKENAQALRACGVEAFLLPYKYNQGCPKDWYITPEKFVARVASALE